MAAGNREDFLRSVRSGLGRSGPTPPVSRERLLGPRAQVENAAVLRAKLEERSPSETTALLDTLEQELGRVEARVARVGSPAEMEAYLVNLMAERQAKSVVTWDTPLLAGLELLFKGLGVSATAIVGTGEQPRAEVLDALISADLGITEADFAVADIGSLVLLSGEHQSRLVSLLPPVHVALVRATSVVPSLADLLPLLGAHGPEGSGRLSSAVTFISGPSRTADIEAVRVIGIHGPIEAHALILEYL